MKRSLKRDTNKPQFKEKKKKTHKKKNCKCKLRTDARRPTWIKLWIRKIPACLIDVANTQIQSYKVWGGGRDRDGERKKEVGVLNCGKLNISGRRCVKLSKVSWCCIYNWLIRWIEQKLIHSFSHSFSQSVSQSVSQWLIDWFIHSFIHQSQSGIVPMYNWCCRPLAKLAATLLYYPPKQFQRKN